jgi:hypothetical protein
VRPPSKSLKLRHDFAAAYTGRDCDVEIGSKEVPTLARMHTGPHPLRGCVSRDSSEIQDQKIEIKPRGGLKIAIPAGIRAQTPHCADVVGAGNSLSRAVFLQTFRLRGFDTVLVNV